MGAWPEIFFLKQNRNSIKQNRKWKLSFYKFNDDIKFCFQQLRAISHYSYDHKSFREFYSVRENEKSFTLVCRYYI